MKGGKSITRNYITSPNKQLKINQRSRLRAEDFYPIYYLLKRNLVFLISSLKLWMIHTLCSNNKEMKQVEPTSVVAQVNAYLIWSSRTNAAVNTIAGFYVGYFCLLDARKCCVQECVYAYYSSLAVYAVSSGFSRPSLIRFLSETREKPLQ